MMWILFIFVAFWVGFGTCAMLSAGKISDMEQTIWLLRKNKS